MAICAGANYHSDRIVQDSDLVPLYAGSPASVSCCPALCRIKLTGTRRETVHRFGFVIYFLHIIVIAAARKVNALGQ